MSIAASAHVCLLKPDGTPAGGGVLIARQYVATCAHVAALAWGEEMTVAQAQAAPIKLCFPFRDNAEASAIRVPHFQPYVPGQGSDSDIAILELDRGFGGWVALSSVPLAAAGQGFILHGHHENGTVGARIDGTVVCVLPDKRIQVGGGERTGSYFIRPGASGCGVFAEGSCIGIAAVYDTERHRREGFVISAPLLHEALEPLLRQSGRPRLRLALGDDFQEARADLAKAEFLCGTQQAASDGSLHAFLDCGFDEAMRGTARLTQVDVRAVLPKGTDAKVTIRSERADDAPVQINERGRSTSRRPIWGIAAQDGTTLCDQKVRCSKPAFIIEEVKAGQEIGAEVIIYPGKDCVDDELEGTPDPKTLSAAKKKLLKRLKIRQELGEVREDGSILLCQATRIVEEVPE